MAFEHYIFLCVRERMREAFYVIENNSGREIYWSVLR